MNIEKDFIKQETNRCLHCKIAGCKRGCPIHNSIPTFIECVKNGDLYNAFLTIFNNNPLFGVCSIICPHEKQCMGHCVRRIKGEEINIPNIEQFVFQEAIKNNYFALKQKPHIGLNAACIGTGPASIAFAITLALEGFEVTMFEKESFFGGVLSWGIPSYRLDKSIVKFYYDLLIKLGVSIKFNYEIGKDIYFYELKGKYDYVFIGVGVNKARDTKLANRELGNVILAEEFLRKTNKNNINEYGKNIVISGGGNVALDAARNAIRLPGVENVFLVYRRTENEMPGNKAEFNDAIKEGVKFYALTNPMGFTNNHELECYVMELGEPDESGRRSPVISDKPHIYLPIDTLILALGSFLDNPFKDIEENDYHYIKVNERGLTNLPNVYAGGDCVSGAKTVVEAVKSGRDAAHDITNKFND